MTDTTVAFVLGTRPEIIKLAPVIQECNRRRIPFSIIHTGQHYSELLDSVFFDQFRLPEPDYNLGVGSGTHGEQTGKMLAAIEQRLLAEEPSVVVVQGDTNSVLAGALAGSKLDVDVAHVEAGLRSFDREMPEEINRVLVDHTAEYLFAPTTESARLLKAEGIDDSRITVTGNTIVDALTQGLEVVESESSILDDLGLTTDEFCLLTAHREENVDSRERFEALLDGVNEYAERAGLPVVYPIHPRAQDRLDEFDMAVPLNVRLVDPVDYLDFLKLERDATLVFTDSGGVQEETCVLGTPCVTLRDNTERPETISAGANCLAGTSPDHIATLAELMASRDTDWSSPFGDGRAGYRILETLDIDAPVDKETATPTTQKQSATQE